MIKQLLITCSLFLCITFVSSGQQNDSTNSSNEEYFKVVDKSATFPGGMNSFYEYISKNVKYPQEKKKKKGSTAKIYIMFVINQDGSIDQESVGTYTGNQIAGANSNLTECKPCEEEAIRLIKDSPKWIPGESNSKPVRQRMVVPIFFTGL